jgi:hypothetical protein
VAAKKIAVGFPKLQANAIYCRQTLFFAGKRYLLQANAIYCRQTLFIAGKRYLLQANAIYCRHIK